MFVFTVLMILITLLNIIVHYLRQHQEVEQEYGQANTSPSSSGLQCRRFSLAEIKSATQNFDEGLVIGKGGFGQVYKGIIDNGESIVAIKRLGFWSNQGAPEFWTEVEMLSKFRHSHLVSLIGYCNDKPEMIIVYEYMPSGTLADNLHKFGRTNRPLSWEQRLKVCIGAAHGLDYLHTGTSIQTRVIHRDVKSSNILLDANREAKISDFGLSKIGPTEQPFSHVSTHVKGTFGYLDPEYLLTHRLTRKSDVYAFGVIMFEALCGRQALDVRLDEEQWALAKWAKHCIKEGRLLEIVDPHLRGSILSNCLEAFAQIAEQCLHKSSIKRPTMAEVVTRLEYALALQETTNISLMDAEIIINGEDYDNQEGSVSSTEAEARNAGGRNFSAIPEAFDAGNVGHSEEHATNLSQSHIQPAKKMTFVKKLQLLFTSKALVITGKDDEYSDLRLGKLKRFSLRELKVATNNFSDKNFLGRGRFGNAYRGCLADGSLVAIMRLVVNHTQSGELQFQTEVKIIGRAIHRNLLQLQGFGTTSTERLLVYPYMVNGSVASHLRDQPEWQSVLDWSTRKKIALGSARGLAYLHEDCIPRILHRDIRAESIFLNENFEAVIGNFGLAQLMNNSDTLVLTSIIRYAAPEYLTTDRCSMMTDVYAFGVLLLELITGQRAFDPAQRANADDVMMFDWVKKLVMERKLETLAGMGPQINYVVEEVEQLMQVVLLCTQYSPMKRPRMSEVVRMLEGDGLTSRWEEWQKEEIFHNTSHAVSIKDIGSEELSNPR